MMRNAWLGLTLLLAACGQPAPEAPVSAQAAAAAPSWEMARAAGVDFRGIGQEPGWTVDVYTDQHIVLFWNYGEESAVFPSTPPTTSSDGATTYQAEANGHTLAITIRRTPCQDAMSGENYPASVEIVIDQQQLNGCGKTV